MADVWKSLKGQVQFSLSVDVFSPAVVVDTGADARADARADDDAAPGVRDVGMPAGEARLACARVESPARAVAAALGLQRRNPRQMMTLQNNNSESNGSTTETKRKKIKVYNT